MILATIGLLILLLALSLPVASALGILGLTLGEVFSGMPLHRALGETAWAANSEVIIIAVPLFILMGEILLRSGVAEQMYGAMIKWLSWLPGGLMHSNIGRQHDVCASSARAQRGGDIGTVSSPEMRKYGYNPKLFWAARRRGNAWHPHSTVDQSDRLRRPHRYLDPTALPGGVPPGILACLALYADHRHRLCVSSRMGWSTGEVRLEGPHRELAGLAASVGVVHHCHRFDLRGDRYAYRISLARRDFVAHPGSRQATSVMASVASGHRRHDAHHGNDPPDFYLGLFSQLRHRRGRSDAADQQPDPRSRIVATGDDLRHRDLLYRAWLLHGDNGDDDHDGADPAPVMYRWATTQSGLALSSSCSWKRR